MVKKILFLTLFLLTLSSFSQEKSIQKMVASPNPFTNKTTISFNSTKSQEVILTIRNVLGKTVFSKRITTVNGYNTIPFYRNDLKSGMYIYALQSSKHIISKRFVVK